MTSLQPDFIGTIGLIRLWREKHCSVTLIDIWRDIASIIYNAGYRPGN